MARISVIMGVYNGSGRVKRAIRSILNQDFTNFEFIICDDGSTDNSVEEIKEMMIEDSRIKLIQNGVNLGLAPSLNKCISLATGEFIARMDDDDYSHPNRLSTQVKFLDSNEKYTIVGTGRNMYDGNGIWGKTIGRGERNKEQIYKGHTFVHPTVLMRTEQLKLVGNYCESDDANRTEDFDLWCNFYANGFIGYNLEEVLFDYYESRDSYQNRKYRYRINEFKLRMKWRRQLGLPPHYILYAIKPLIIGLVPSQVLIQYKKHKFKKV